MQIERGDPLGVQETLNDIRAKHLNEPGIAEATYRLLYTAGLLTPRGLPTGGGPMEAPAATPSRLWTPDQGAARRGAEPGRRQVGDLDAVEISIATNAPRRTKNARRNTSGVTLQSDRSVSSVLVFLRVRRAVVVQFS